MTGFYGSEICLPNCCAQISTIYDLPWELCKTHNKDFNKQHLASICEALVLYGRISYSDKICVFSKTSYDVGSTLAQYFTLQEPITVFYPASKKIDCKSFEQAYKYRFDLIIVFDCLNDILAEKKEFFKCLKSCVDPTRGKILVIQRNSLTFTLPVVSNVHRDLMKAKYSVSNLISDVLHSNLDIEWDVFRICFSLPALDWIKMLKSSSISPLDSIETNSEYCLNVIAQLIDSKLRYTPKADIYSNVNLCDNLFVLFAQFPQIDAISLPKLMRSPISIDKDSKNILCNKEMNQYEYQIPIELNSKVRKEMFFLYGEAQRLYKPKFETTSEKMKGEEWWGNTLHNKIAATDSNRLETRRLNSYFTSIFANRINIKNLKQSSNEII